MGVEVDKIFIGDECQGDAGNLSHLHVVVVLKKKCNGLEGKKLIESAIREFIDEIVAVDEVDKCVTEGILDSWADCKNLKNQA